MTSETYRKSAGSTSKTGNVALAIAKKLTFSSGLTLAYLYWTFKYAIFESYQPQVHHGDVSLTKRMVFAGRVQIVPILFVYCMTVITGFVRMFTSASDPIDPSKQGPVVVLRNIIQNTLEQTVVHVGAVLCLASFVDAPDLHMIVSFTVLFVVGRILFMIGYLNSAYHRTFGMVMNFTGNGMLLIACGISITSKGLLHGFLD